MSSELPPPSLRATPLAPDQTVRAFCNASRLTPERTPGTPRAGRDYRGGGAGSRQLLNSPWDVAVTAAGDVFVAMAGQHQIWRYEVASGTTSMVSGNGAHGVSPCHPCLLH